VLAVLVPLSLCVSWGDIPALCCLAERELNLTECLPAVGISSCGDLIADQVLQVLIWIVAALCVVFNVLVAIWRVNENKVQHRMVFCSCTTFTVNIIVGSSIMVVAFNVYYLTLHFSTGPVLPVGQPGYQ